MRFQQRRTRIGRGDIRRKGRETKAAARHRRLSSDDVWDGLVRAGRTPCPKTSILRKEVIQPQVPLRLPCYDFGPVADPTVAGCLLAVSAPSSGKTNSHAVTGGVYKARERIHRSLLFCDY
jgi:hypothetical protein